MAITILEGSNFCISDQNGDFTFTTSGLYAYDMRFLSRLELTVNGERPLLLSAGKAEYYSAAYFLRNPVAGELPQDSVSVGRHRFVGEGGGGGERPRAEGGGRGRGRGTPRGGGRPAGGGGLLCWGRGGGGGGGG